jgi:hypothetical protein
VVPGPGVFHPPNGPWCRGTGRRDRRSAVHDLLRRGERDSDGPVEFCWPVPDDQAAEIAAGFLDLTLRTEPAHQEAFVGQGRPGIWGSGTEIEVAIEALVARASEQQRQPSGGVRSMLIFNPANQGAGPDCEFAVALR